MQRSVPYIFTFTGERSLSLEMMVKQFNETYKPNDIQNVAVVPLPDGQELFGSLIVEELQELALGFDNGDRTEIFDAIIDIIYVCAQQGQLHGYPIDAGLREVQRSNMSKLGEDGKPILREDGKVLKGPNFSEPNLAAILEQQNG